MYGEPQIMYGELQIGLTPRESAIIEMALIKNKDYFMKNLENMSAENREWVQRYIGEINAIIKKIKME